MKVEVARIVQAGKNSGEEMWNTNEISRVSALNSACDNLAFKERYHW